MRLYQTLALTLCWAAGTLTARAQHDYDVVVYGGTSAAVMAAVEVARVGKSVAIVSPDARLGGLSSNGLGWTDIGSRDSIGGLSKEFYGRVYDHYLDPGSWVSESRQQYINRSALDPDAGRQMMFTFEPKVAEQIFNDFVSEHNITLLNGRLNRESGIGMSGGRITSISTLGGDTINGGAFIDATYEGDLMAASGVSYTVGREANSLYGESLNGIQAGLNKNQLPRGIDPYMQSGNPASGLLPGVSPDPGGANGEEDERLQAYNFRMAMTNDPANRAPIAKPAGYDAADYELLLRAVEAGQTSRFWKTSPMPNLKTDSNNDAGFSTDYIGGNYDLATGWNYAEGDYESRDAMIREHRDFQLGLVWTVQNDPRVPQAIRDAWGQWGLPLDEFTENGNWPDQIYVREARRMVGEVVINQNHVDQEPGYLFGDSIAMGGYAMDSHHTQRHVTSAGDVQNEGDVQIAPARGPYGISYRAITPQAGEVENLLVPVALSASHIAYGSIRMEPVFMSTGQAAGAAAVLALDSGTSVQDVDYGVLRQSLLAAGAVLTPELPDPVASSVRVDFNDASGLPVNLRNRADGDGWTGVWDGTGTEQIVAGSLTYTGGGYGLDQDAGRAPGKMQGNYHEPRQNTRDFEHTMQGDIWFSMLVENPDPTAVVGLSFNPSGNGDPDDGPIESLLVLDGETLSFEQQGVASATRSGLAAGEAHLIVGRLSLGSSEAILRVWADPELVGPLGTPDLLVSNSSLPAALGGLGLLSYNPAGPAFSAAGGYLDALRISNEPDAFFTITGANQTADINGDGVVDFDDLSVIRSHYLVGGATLADGDANRDGVVNARDYFIWRTAYLAAGGDPAAITGLVPEPAGLGLTMAIGAALAMQRRGGAVRAARQARGVNID